MSQTDYAHAPRMLATVTESGLMECVVLRINLNLLRLDTVAFRLRTAILVSKHDRSLKARSHCTFEQSWLCHVLLTLTIYTFSNALTIGAVIVYQVIMPFMRTSPPLLTCARAL